MKNMNLDATSAATECMSPDEARALLAMPRAISGGRVRMDATDPKVLIEQIQASVKEMRDLNDKRIEKLEAKVDPLDTEQFNKIAAAVQGLQGELDAQAKTIAAYKLGGNDISPLTDADYTTKFNAYFRDGAHDSELKALQKVGPRAALTEGSAGNGGYTTPVEWDRTITNKLKLMSPLRAEAQVISISTVGFSKVFNDRAVGSGWVGETAVRVATTTPNLTSLPWAIGEIYANAAASQDLLDDSLIDIAAWLTEEIDYEFSRQEGIAFIGGDGVNKPNGLLTYLPGNANAALHPFGSIGTVPSGGVGVYTTDAIVSLIYALPAMWQPNAKFYANRASMASVMKLKNGQGNYIWQPSFQAGQPQTLMNAPVIDLPDMPTVTTGSTPMLYGDMRATYLVIDRMGTRVLRDPYTNKPFVMFYTTKRVGGGVQNPESMKGITIG